MTIKWRKKTEIGEAFQMTKERRWDNSEWPDWLNMAWNKDPGIGALWIDPDAPIADGQKSADRLLCGASKGDRFILWGDWLVLEPSGGIEVYDQEEFAESYDMIEEQMGYFDVHAIPHLIIKLMGAIVALTILSFVAALLERACLDIRWKPRQAQSVNL